MALGTCKLCRKIFTAELGRDGKVCPECRQRLDELYGKVRNYLRDHPKEEFDVERVTEALEADIRDVEALVDLGYLDRDVPDAGSKYGGDADREKLAKAFEASIDKLKASAAAAAAHKPVSYGQELYGDKGKKR